MYDLYILFELLEDGLINVVCIYLNRLRKKLIYVKCKND